MNSSVRKSLESLVGSSTYERQRRNQDARCRVANPLNNEIDDNQTEVLRNRDATIQFDTKATRADMRRIDAPSLRLLLVGLLLDLVFAEIMPK